MKPVLFGTTQYNYILLESAGWIKLDTESSLQVDGDFICNLESDEKFLTFHISSIKAIKYANQEKR